jgi:anti-sigma B factor antagonist
MRDYEFHVTVAAPDNGTTLVSVRGDVDIATSPTLRRVLDAAHGHVVVDLSRVTLIDASGLSVLVEAARSADRDGHNLVLRNPSTSCTRALEITRLVSVFRIDAGPSSLGDGNAHYQRRSRPHHARDLDQSAQRLHAIP